jgi:hypothetical protein
MVVRLTHVRIAMHGGPNVDAQKTGGSMAREFIHTMPSA